MYNKANFSVLQSGVRVTVGDIEPFLLLTDAHNVKKRRVIKTF